MSPITPVLRTERLVLREWRDSDREPYAELNADPVVMEHFPATLTRAESEAHVDRIVAAFATDGFGLWAVEVVGGDPFIGFIGLGRPRFEASFTPCVEVGWRLSRPSWGQGLAPEGALEALRFGFESAELDEIVSFTTLTNTRSQRVMERIGMRRDPAEDWDHPRVAPGDPLRRHVLYRMSAERWRQNRPITRPR